jgi:hypothetical protein
MSYMLLFMESFGGTQYSRYNKQLIFLKALNANGSAEKRHLRLQQHVEQTCRRHDDTGK